MSTGTTSGSSRRRPPTASADQPAGGWGEPRADGVPERMVLVRPRTVAMSALVLLALALALWIVWAARQVLTWVLVAMFLAVALDPAVSALERRGLRRRGPTTAVIFLAALLALAGLLALLVPPLVRQVEGLVAAVPGYVDQLTSGRGPLGSLERHHHVVERAQKAVSGDAAARLLGGAGTVLSIT